ncbi:hypothetical protein RYX36_015272 [Vicia faba]
MTTRFGGTAELSFRAWAVVFGGASFRDTDGSTSTFGAVMSAVRRDATSPCAAYDGGCQLEVMCEEEDRRSRWLRLSRVWRFSVVVDAVRWWNGLDGGVFTVLF